MPDYSVRLCSHLLNVLSITSQMHRYPFPLFKKPTYVIVLANFIITCRVTTTNSLTQNCSFGTEYTHFMGKMKWKQARLKRKNTTKSTFSLLLFQLHHLHKRFANGKRNVASGCEINSGFNTS